MRERLLNLFGIDLRSLAVFRMGLGLLLLADLLVRSQDMTAFYTDAGAFPRDLLIAQSPNAAWLSLHLWSGSWAWQAILFTAAAILAVALGLGYRTRGSVFLSWLLLVSLQARNPLILNGGDVLLRTLLMWSNFLPLGACWSLDARRRPNCPSGSFLSPASAAILLHVCLMYWMTGYFKYEGWSESPNVFYQVIEFQSYSKPFVHSLLQYPHLVRWLGHGVLALEAVGPLLLFIPCGTKWIRLWVGAAFLLLHLGIELSLTVGMFTYVSWCAWLLFLPEIFWDGCVRLVPSLKRATDPPWPANGGAAGWEYRWEKSRLAAILAVLLFGYVVSWNLSTARNDWNRAFRESTPMWVNDLLLVRQRWNMFSLPAGRDGWFVMVARLRDGAVVDLLRGGAPADWDSFSKPSLIYQRYPNHRWRKFYRNVAVERANAFLPSLCRFAVHRWEQEHGPERAVQKVELYFMQQMSRDPEDRDLFMQRIVHEEVFAATEAVQETP